LGWADEPSDRVRAGGVRASGAVAAVGPGRPVRRRSEVSYRHDQLHPSEQHADEEWEADEAAIRPVVASLQIQSVGTTCQDSSAKSNRFACSEAK
jgi:hypothetical protein